MNVILNYIVEIALVSLLLVPGGIGAAINIGALWLSKMDGPQEEKGMLQKNNGWLLTTILLSAIGCYIACATISIFLIFMGGKSLQWAALALGFSFVPTAILGVWTGWMEPKYKNPSSSGK